MEAQLYICKSCGTVKTPTIKQSWDHMTKSFSALGEAFKSGMQIPSPEALTPLEIQCPDCQTTMHQIQPGDKLALRGTESKTPPELATLPFKRNNPDDDPDVPRRVLTIVQWQCIGCQDLLTGTDQTPHITCACGKRYEVNGPWNFMFGDPVTVREEEVKRDE